MERKYLLPSSGPIFQVRDHVGWAARGILKDKYGHYTSSQLSDHIEEVYDDLEKIGYKILIWASECETLYLRGNSEHLSKSQRDRIADLTTKLASEGTNSSVTLEDDLGHFEKLWEYNGNPDGHNIPPPVMESFQRYYSKSKVRDYLRTNQYIVHGVDNLETLKSILASGLRPRTQISNAEGQGIDSGPYILVYPTKAKRRGHEVDYRAGDFLGASVHGKPIVILFDVGELMDLPPIEVLEKGYEASHDKLIEYVRTKYPTAIGPDGKVDWKIFGELEGFSDRAFKLLETKNRRASDDYFAVVDDENYKAKDSADRLKELQEIVTPYKIPIKQIDFDSSVDDYVFVRYTS